MDQIQNLTKGDLNFFINQNIQKEFFLGRKAFLTHASLSLAQNLKIVFLLTLKLFQLQTILRVWNLEDITKMIGRVYIFPNLI